MRLIKKGVIKRKFTGRWSCRECGSEWELDATDPEPHLVSDQREGDYYQMDCPTCGYKVMRRASA